MSKTDATPAADRGSGFSAGLGLPVAAYDAGNGVKIEAAKQMDGRVLWAIRHFGSVMNLDGEWEFEPLPSSRDDEFIARCRHATPQEALDVLRRLGKRA